MSREGEAPAEPLNNTACGSAGASPSREKILSLTVTFLEFCFCKSWKASYKEKHNVTRNSRLN